MMHGIPTILIVALTASAGAQGLSRTPPRQISGSISSRDYPAASLPARPLAAVRVRLAVLANGNVASCAVVRSSGHRILDDATCPLVRERFRFQPATADGRPVPGHTNRTIIWTPPR